MSSSIVSRSVKTQAELDRALADKVRDIWIESPAGVWLEIGDSGSATVSAYDSATVRAYDSATVRAYESATVSAYDSATVRAYGSATVSAYGSATVSAYGSATVSAYGSATVRAYDSATVRAYGSATVSATKFVAIHLHSKRVQLDGQGHVIDITDFNLEDPRQWCEYHGIEVNDDGIAYVYKAVGDDWNSRQKTIAGFTSYAPGTTPEAPDWNPARHCGGGLHFSPTPGHALYYREDATKFVRCGVRLDEMVILTDKVKAKRVVVPCVEVDEHARTAEAVTK